MTFKYDPFGRRIQKSSSLGTTNYLYDGPNLIEELDQSGSVLARYTQGEDLDQTFAEIRSGTAAYYEQDGVNSVTSLNNSMGTLANTRIRFIRQADGIDRDPHQSVNAHLDLTP